MSYQFIYTSTLQPGYTSPRGGMIARSHALPRILADELVNLSTPPHTEASLQSKKCFSYQTVVCGGSTFHVLTCIQRIETSQSSIPTWSAHHLALTQDEVLTLRRNASRPTPAGLIMALSRIGLWKSQWDAETIYIEDEPTLTAAALPDPSLQPTWKKLTEHKSNARAFLVAPYDRDCIIIMPDGSNTEDILMLCHESDWLSSSRGWGKTFTTQALTVDHCQQFARAFTDAQHAPQLIAACPKHPTLHINSQFSIDEHNSGDPASHPLGSGAPQRTSEPPNTQDKSAAAHAPYKFAECPDEDVFNVLPRPNKMVRWMCCLAGAGILWCSASLISGLFIDEAGELTGDIISRINTEEDLLLLAELASTPFSKDNTQDKLNRIESHFRTRPEAHSPGKKDILLQECINILRSAQDVTGHAENLHRLHECTTAIGIDANNVCRLYMHEATHARPVEEWLANTTPEEVAILQKLLKDNPDMEGWLIQPPFDSYIVPLLQLSEKQTEDTAECQPKENIESHPATEGEPQNIHEPTSSEDATPKDGPPSPAQSAETSTDNIPRQPETLEPTISLHGDVLPDSLLSLLSETRLELTSGEYCVCSLGNSGEVQQTLKFTLGDGTYSLAITPTQPGIWALQVLNAGSPDPLVPIVGIQLQEGKLSQLTINGSPAAIKLHTTDAQGNVGTYYLISPTGLTFTPISAAPIPPAKNIKIFQLTPKDIEFSKGRARKKPAKITLKNSVDFSSLSGKVPVKLEKRPELFLPQLAANTQLVIEYQPPIEKKYQLLSKAADKAPANTSKWTFELQKLYEFDAVIKNYINIAANKYNCGNGGNGDDFFSLATLYGITEKAENREKRIEQAERYLELHEDKKFARELNIIFDGHPELVISHKEATDIPSERNKTIRRLAGELHAQATLRKIKTLILQVLSNTASNYYKVEYEEQVNENLPTLELSLRKIEITDNGSTLKWIFVLTPKPL